MPSSRRKVTANFNGGLRAARPTLDTAKLLFILQKNGKVSLAVCKYSDLFKVNKSSEYHYNSIYKICELELKV